ncbi:peptidyl-prolyl cis-trans isomerase [Chondromyces crocatus]|uniref:PpiC domain-containing protein n=1 Tax=Chondromyces crocatus TaxID=52 RepID=A0A0K1ERZ3_CHOCO|nr:peptidyl-prolyl cis-trans isomerase [Chondromyces crocatus]AKT43393.1 uncharacterized protein CMC5_076250 [Chondromyces crocatus]
MSGSRYLPTLLAAAVSLGLLGCNEKAVEQLPDAGASAFGLSAEQSSRVLAKVGDRVITLGDFAAALDQMDQFDRLRYQSKERRRELLSELVDVELLAMEAQRRGLDKEPDVQDALRQTMRDAILAQERRSLPAPAEISAEEVRAYFDANSDKFVEPERRRLAAIVLKSRADAEKVLKEAQKANTAIAWGELFFKQSISAPKVRDANAPVDLAGDLGIVGPPGDARGGNPQIPEPLRVAAFQIGNVGEVAPEVLEAQGKYYVIRMTGITAGHRRTLAEADRSIRVALLQRKTQEQEASLRESLKQKIRVEVDEAALASVKLPDPATAGPYPGYQPPSAPTSLPSEGGTKHGNGGN